ncbi:hypothetical protein F5B22DRAFT_658197 [Xylaria bambusicola]|uniref:uncharacterized protein n=1 Tax=Xylaria bambusicola TaxID=326684 RepID=UPI0020077436|nr:uncharacterized protein F5B22DRAFT_658197 [Xylaria bambusicola]KAI0525295.1 hypothetical protein F5B22DRAFT_658197 [Xylaria bambusicola]
MTSTSFDSVNCAIGANALKSTISDFGLIREPTVWEPKDTAFIDPYLVYASMKPSLHFSPPTIPGWASYKITLPRPGSSQKPKLLNGYAVSPLHNAYVTFCVQLTSPDVSKRYTPMRYRDMIVDNYISACIASSTAPLSELRWLGIANILNPASRATFERIFQLTGRNILSRGVVEISPTIELKGDFPKHKEFHKLLLADPFTRGVIALLHQHAEALGRASVKRFIFVSEGFEAGEFPRRPSPLELRLNLIVELTRSDDSVAGLWSDASRYSL